MAIHTITISATTASPYPLTISDEVANHSASSVDGDRDFTTVIASGDTVYWAISGNISSIVNIIDDSAPLNLFSSGPAPMNDGTGRWMGTVGPRNTNAESYSIEYNVTGAAANPYKEDPKLIMN